MSRVGSNTDDVSHRTDEPALQRIPNLKEFFVAIPIVTTLIAVLYDVGYFIGVDPSYFSFFSLSEHTLFFFMAMPFALILTIVGLPLVAAIQTVINRFVVGEHPVASGKKIPIILNPFALVLGPIICAIFLIFILSFGLSAAKAALSCGDTVHSLVTKSEVFLKIRILRSDERGILFYNFEKRAIELLPWSEIREIVTIQRHPSIFPFYCVAEKA